MGLVVMFFPPHFITLFFAPFVGGTVAGLRCHATFKRALVMGVIMACLITGMAMAGATLMMTLAQDGDEGLGAQLKKMDMTSETARWAAVGLWFYAAISSSAGGWLGGFLKRLG